MSQSIIVKKKDDIKLMAVQCEADGSMTDDRNEERLFVKGDWILKTADGRQWPVDNEYFIANYVEVARISEPDNEETKPEEENLIVTCEACDSHSQENKTCTNEHSKSCGGVVNGNEKACELFQAV